jgi:predicted nucleic acid-binding Zn ribbon protein
MIRYDAICENCGLIEIKKSMIAPFPKCCQKCGGDLARKFHSPRVIYNAPGFYEYDHQMRRHMSPARYDWFSKRKEEILNKEKDAI